MNPKKTTKWLTIIIVIMTFILLGIYITLMSIDAKNFEGWLQIISITIQLLASFIGVFLALRMSQWISDKEETEKVKDLWRRIGKFLEQLKNGIESDKGLMELADYKLYWQSVQNASYESAKVLHNDEKYMEISSVFSFLSYHESEWQQGSYSFTEWIARKPNLKDEIQAWKEEINKMITYVNGKTK